MVDEILKKKTTSPGLFTHWARPRWLRMYDYNYEYGESYYRNQVRYVSTSKYSSESSSSVDTRRAYLARRRAQSPPRAKSFIERWAEEPFYGRGFSRARSEVRASAASNYASDSLLSQIRSTRESSAAVQKQSQSIQEQIRQRRARSVEAIAAAANDAYYASDDCLMRSNALNARSSSVARSVRAQSVAAELDSSYSRQVRASSVSRSRREQSYSAELDSSSSYSRQVREGSVSRSRREQSYSSEADSQSAYSRQAREGSLTRSTLAVNDSNVLVGTTLDNSINYEYPRQHLVCTEKCPLFSNPEHHRRFVIGNRFLDAAALGGFDVLYDPAVYKKTRSLLQRFSQERQIEPTIYESSRETESQSRQLSQSSTQSRSRIAYKTIY